MTEAFQHGALVDVVSCWCLGPTEVEHDQQVEDRQAVTARLKLRTAYGREVGCLRSIAALSVDVAPRFLGAGAGAAAVSARQQAMARYAQMWTGSAALPGRWRSFEAAFDL